MVEYRILDLKSFSLTILVSWLLACPVASRVAVEGTGVLLGSRSVCSDLLLRKLCRACLVPSASDVSKWQALKSVFSFIRAGCSARSSISKCCVSVREVCRVISWIISFPLFSLSGIPVNSVYFTSWLIPWLYPFSPVLCSVSASLFWCLCAFFNFLIWPFIYLPSHYFQELFPLWISFWGDGYLVELGWVRDLTRLTNSELILWFPTTSSLLPTPTSETPVPSPALCHRGAGFLEASPLRSFLPLCFLSVCGIAYSLLFPASRIWTSFVCCFLSHSSCLHKFVLQVLWKGNRCVNVCSSYNI